MKLRLFSRLYCFLRGRHTDEYKHGFIICARCGSTVRLKGWPK